MSKKKKMTPKKKPGRRYVQVLYGDGSSKVSYVSIGGPVVEPFSVQFRLPSMAADVDLTPECAENLKIRAARLLRLGSTAGLHVIHLPRSGVITIHYDPKKVA